MARNKGIQWPLYLLLVSTLAQWGAQGENRSNTVLVAWSFSSALLPGEPVLALGTNPVGPWELAKGQLT